MANLRPPGVNFENQPNQIVRSANGAAHMSGMPSHET
jgi:hypothetical protein